MAITQQTLSSLFSKLTYDSQLFIKYCNLFFRFMDDNIHNYSKSYYRLVYNSQKIFFKRIDTQIIDVYLFSEFLEKDCACFYDDVLSKLYNTKAQFNYQAEHFWIDNIITQLRKPHNKVLFELYLLT